MRWKGKVIVLSIRLPCSSALRFSILNSLKRAAVADDAGASESDRFADSRRLSKTTTNVIKIDTEVVNVLFTAQDKNRRLLTDLKQEDVKLLEDGQPQEIVAFSQTD